MRVEEFEAVLKVGEHIGVEFKSARGGAKDDVFETVCSFLNRFGGDIFLGVADDGEVLGVPENAAAGMIKNVIRVTNNPELLNPTFYVYSEPFVYKDKTVIRIHVPQSSDVHRYKGVCYDRVYESDVQVQSSDQIAEMYVRKRGIYTERKLFPFLRPEHLRLDLLPMIRNLIYSKYATHPWLKLDDRQLLSESGLYEEDFVTGKKSFNAAAVLLLGRDDVIFNCFPAYKTDALVKKVNVDRYDDRETVTCNLVEAYDKLMAFGAKHLPDKFHLEDAIRVSLRDKILREMIGNTLVHREFSSARPANFVIYADRMMADNASKALRCGPVTPDNLSPVSKNPIIARFFKQMGRADELGSGTKNLYHYSRLYSGCDPQLDEGDTFKVTVPLNDAHSADKGDPIKPHEGINETVNDPLSSHGPINDPINDPIKIKVMGFISEEPGINREQLASRMGKSVETVKRAIAPLVAAGKIEHRGSKKTGGYYAI